MDSTFAADGGSAEKIIARRIIAFEELALNLTKNFYFIV